MNIEFIVFKSAKSLFNYLNRSNAINDMELFYDVRPCDMYTNDPSDNIGYVVKVDSDIAGAAILEDENSDGSIYFNHLFEIVPKYRGKGIAQKLYQHIKDDLKMDYIHGFAPNDKLKKYWANMGQICISEITREMVEPVSENSSIKAYLEKNSLN